MRIPNKSLVDAAISVLSEHHMPVERSPAKGRAMIYRMPDGRSVRLRTCNDHVLVVVADTPEVDAPVNIEGTDMLLVVMPEVERTPGSVVTFLLPAEIAARDAREGYRQWLDNNPKTKGQNNTRTIWFDDDLSKASHGFMRRWESYRLDSEIQVQGEQEAVEVSTQALAQSSVSMVRGVPKLRDVVDAAKTKIAEAAGVNPEDVHISINMY